MNARSGKKIVSGLLPIALLLGAGFDHNLPGQEGDSGQPSVGIEEAFERLDGKSSEPGSAADLPGVMTEASRRVEAGDLPDALRKQQQALEELDRLLAELQSATPQQETAGAREQEVAGGKEADPDETGRQTGAPGSGAAQESVSGNRPGEPSSTVVRRRRSLATSVWGHLPDRYREEMQQGYRERYLPEYENLVERYYEALAKQKREAPAADSR